MKDFAFYVLMFISLYLCYNVYNNNSKCSTGKKFAIETKKASKLAFGNIKEFYTEIKK